MPDAEVSLRLQPLSGGLESPVALVAMAAGGRADVPLLVVKHLKPHMGREADVYELLWKHLPHPPAPRLFGMEQEGDAHYLYLEPIAGCSTWPWLEPGATAVVCRALARLHDSTALPREAFAWNYEQELSASAQTTLALASVARAPDGSRFWTRLGDLRRVVAALPGIRRVLLDAGVTVIHGDVHPGNVLVRGRHGGSREAVFIDWGRARVGSPLEDIASWLQSLGCWEPQARRRHDSLLRAYLNARSTPVALTPERRATYWLASASNGLAGAIRYHLAVLGDPATTEQLRSESGRALESWMRVCRRAASLLGMKQWQHLRS